ncbi:hypothetical protein KR018_007365 [Drosophila ironensis]|nr:hypothetical protein KR018_007365 [Drosophila ironensis]
MWHHNRVKWPILVLFKIAYFSFVFGREFIPEHDYVLGTCHDMPGEFLTIDNIADTSQITFKRAGDGINVSGNATYMLDPSFADRVEIDASVFKQVRGKWKPTGMTANMKNLCAVLYDKNQIQYPYFSEHVTNRDEIKDKCFSAGVSLSDMTNVPNSKFLIFLGQTLLTLEPYLLKITLGSAVPVGPGHYKIVLKFIPYTKSGAKGSSICMEIPGDVK